MVDGHGMKDMKELCWKLSESLHKGESTEALREQCTKTILESADNAVLCGDRLARFARTITDSKEDWSTCVKWLKSVLTKARDVPGLLPQRQLDRRLLVSAASVVLDSGRVEVKDHPWVPELGCEEYMDVQFDPELGGPYPHYRFAEFLCYANALLQGRKPAITEDVLHGGYLADAILPRPSWGFGAEDVLTMLDAKESDLEEHGDLRQWLADARAERSSVF